MMEAHAWDDKQSKSNRKSCCQDIFQHIQSSPKKALVALKESTKDQSATDYQNGTQARPRWDIYFYEMQQQVDFASNNASDDKRESGNQQDVTNDTQQAESSEINQEDSCSASENKVVQAGWSKYDIAAEDLRMLVEPNLSTSDPGWRAPPPSISLLEAHEELRKHHSKPLSEKQVAARDRLLEFYRSFGPDCNRLTLIKIMIDLDILLFDDVLRNRIHVEWCDHPSQKTRKSPGMVSAAFTNVAGGYDATRISIHFDIKHAWFGKDGDLPTKAHIFKSPIHEMLHAYTLVKTGAKNGDYSPITETCECESKIFHGSLWRETLNLLYTRLGAPGLTKDNTSESCNLCESCVKRRAMQKQEEENKKKEQKENKKKKEKERKKRRKEERKKQDDQ